MTTHPSGDLGARAVLRRSGLTVLALFIAAGIVALWMGVARGRLPATASALEGATAAQSRHEGSPSEALPAPAGDRVPQLRQEDPPPREEEDPGPVVEVRRPAPDTDFGTVYTMEDYIESSRAACMAFTGSLERFVQRAMGWQQGEMGNRWVDEIPLSDLKAPGFEVTVEAFEQAKRIENEYAEALRGAAHDAYALLSFYADYYARNDMKTLPADQQYRQEWPKDERGRNVYPRYSALLVKPAGPWKFVTDFRSSDHPELEDALAEIERLKAERDREMSAVLR